MTEAAAKPKPKKDPVVFPAAYEPFLPVLDRLSFSMRSALKGHLDSLETLFQAVQNRDRHLMGDFEGVGGLTHRGELSRILQSELLLRTEAPMEFLRRLSEKETLYMETERSDPGEKLIFRLVISAGPELLGHGRIVALACLIFLARVAQLRKTELHWCYLPATRPVWFTDVSVNNVKRFLKFTSFRNVAETDLENALIDWSTVFAGKKDADNIFQDWVISAERLGAPAPKASSMPNVLSLIMNPPDGAPVRTGIVDLKRGDMRQKRARIDFPEDRICVSALNRPFAPVRPDQRPGQEKSGVKLPVLGGWEPLYYSSPGPGRYMVKFEKFRRGLLFLEQSIIDNHSGKPQRRESPKLPRSVFIPLPEDTQLAGAHFSASAGQINILVQRGKGKDERMVAGSYIIGGEAQKYRMKYYVKKVTCAHLFSKQRDYAIPPMYFDQGIYGYTTLGQPFRLHNLDDKPALNILYKEKRILNSDGRFNVLQFDPTGKTQTELMREGQLGHFDTPSIGIVHGKKKKTFGFPVGPDLNYDRLRGMVVSHGHQGVGFSTDPGIWRLFSLNAAAKWDSFTETEIQIQPFERVLTCGESKIGTRAMIYSDPIYGGDGRLQLRWYDGRSEGMSVPIKRETLFKFGTAKDPLREVRFNSDGCIWGIYTDDHGDPERLMVLRKTQGQYRRHVINFDDLFNTATELSAEAMFG